MTSESHDVSSSKLERLLAVILVVCAVILVGFVARRELSTGVPAADSSRSIALADAASYRDAGHRIGASSAPVVAVVFSDYQCPFCRRLDRMLRAASRDGGGVATIYRQFPLEDLHENALSAALIAECASDQGAFEPMHALLFTVADTLSRVPLAVLAGRAAVRDQARFAACVRDRKDLGRVTRDVNAGRRLGVQATPTWILGDHVIRGAVDDTTFARLIADARENAQLE